jgi:hypothetical protein
MLGLLYHGTKLEANARNSILNLSAEEKTTRNSVPWKKNISKHLNSVPNHSPEVTITRNSIPKHVSDENMLSTLLAGAGFFVKQIFFMPFTFRSEPRNASE